MPRLPFGTSDYEARSPSLSAQQCVNLYPEAAPPDAHTPVALYGTPGLKPFAASGLSGTCRGLSVMDEVLYGFFDEVAYRIDAAGVVTALTGTIAGTGALRLATNGTQILAVTTDGDGYIVTSSAVTAITDGDFLGAVDVTFQDGYFVLVKPDSNQFYISAPDDGTTYDAADFASAEGQPDTLVAVISDHRELWLAGSQTIEVWYNSGAQDFPFQRASGSYIERGCIAAATLLKADNAVYWVGDDRIVYTAEGYRPVRISDHATERLLTDAADLSDLTAFYYAQDGHSFYVLIKPGAWCRVYDIATRRWHRRRSYGRDDWRVRHHAYAYGRHFVAADTAAKVYELDLATYDEDGEPLVATATAPAIWAEGNRAVMTYFRLDVEPGVGLTTGQGSAPQAMLQWSDDDGRTWSPEYWTGLGAVGEYETVAEWRRLGLFRRRVMKIEISDPVKRVIMGAYADFVPGRR